MDANPLERASELMQRGALESAAELCRSVLAMDGDSVDALHLLGLIRERAGALSEAESLLHKSVVAAPKRAEFRLNLGNFLRRAGRPLDALCEYEALVGFAPEFRVGRLALMRLHSQLGNGAKAEAQARELIRSNARDAEAWSGLAAALRAQEKPVESEAAYKQALSISPNYAVARHNLAALLSQQQRAEEALAELERAVRDGAAGPEVHFNRARALIDLSRFDEAEIDLRRTISLAPTYLDGQVTLAQLRFCRGDGAFARDIIDAATRHSQDSPLQLAVAQLLRASEDMQAAHDWLARALTHAKGAPALSIEFAGLLQEMGQLDRARAIALDTLRQYPNNHAAVGTAVSALLGLGDAHAALSLVNDELVRVPSDQLFIAYRASALRMLDDALYKELYDYDKSVRVYDIATPRDWDSPQAFLDELAAVLGGLHKLQSRPLDQSLRHGTQTARSLLASTAPAIRALLASFESPIADYQSNLGRSSFHPVQARNTAAAKLSGCWSVRLGAGGHHVNHVHPQGWISSAFYVNVPAEAADPQQRAGWLKLGEPRFPFPEATAEKYIQPQPGRLVLFPSCMWHGTTPLQQEERRLSVAFDAVPEKTAGAR